MQLELSDDLKQIKERVCKEHSAAEKQHAVYRRRWNHLYGLYRSYEQFRDEHNATSENDRDRGLAQAKRQWGAELFIPYAFTVVETILPRMLSNRPRMLVLPRDRASEENVENMRSLIDAQQAQMRYEIGLQDTAKSGLIYGLGIQKTFWRNTLSKRKVLVPGMSESWVEGYTTRGWDDPDAEDVDIFDFFWDPFAGSIEECRYVIHRTWRDTAYVKAMVESQKWNNPAGLSVADIESSGSTAKFDSTHQERMVAAGQRDWDSKNNQLHEIWEYHNRGDVWTIMDRETPMQVGSNPAWHGELPFQAYRPTTQGMKQLPGIGEIEPIEDLQQEMNTLRSQRRDNATLKLQQVVAYAEGLVDADDLQFFPGAAIPVNGDPRELLFPINVGDIPNSGYQEEGNLKSDIEMTTGISDPVSGTGDASQTATGVQLVQAAANVRIQLKTRRLEVETIAPATSQMISLNQQRITTNREIRIPALPTPEEPDRRWAWRELGPTELAGEFDCEPEGGSTAPDNVPQNRADAMQLMQLFGGLPELVDPRPLVKEALRLFGLKNVDTYLAPDQRVPPVLMELLVEQGIVPVEKLKALFEQARQMEEQQQTQTGNLPDHQGPGDVQDASGGGAPQQGGDQAQQGAQEPQGAAAQ